MNMQSTIIGAPVTQIEGPSKVTGQTRYAADVDLPGMLWGKILRSPIPTPVSWVSMLPRPGVFPALRQLSPDRTPLVI